MSEQTIRSLVNRRMFIASGLSLLGMATFVEKCTAGPGCPIKFRIHEGFTDDEEEIIDDALQLIANRFVDRDIRDNMYQITGKEGYFLDRGVWKKSNLEEDSDYGGRYELLRFQLIQLRVQGRDGEFPCINIHADHECADWLRSAPGDPYQVAVISHRDSFRVEGEFSSN